MSASSLALLTTLAWIAAAWLVVVVANELQRRAPPWLAIALFAGVPLVASPIWLRSGAPAFSLIKVYSVCLAAVWIALLKVRRNVERRGFRVGAYVILVLNILEAVATGWARGLRLSAIAGLLLVLTLALPDAVATEKSPGRTDVTYALGGSWVLAYSLWNLSFVIGAQPAFAAFALAHVGGPLLAARGRADRWIQARTVGLAVLMIARVSAPHPPWLVLVPEWPSAPFAAALSLAAVVAAVWVIVERLRNVDRSAPSLVEQLVRATVRRGRA